ncbi:hypothetical protein V1512DRAFT_261161 [Lipomyces arxii]|uniref:uncharacterized protein n=1 Tax=Lipomyces arxii TaxID=56418 RepID=UPI0034CD9424
MHFKTRNMTAKIENPALDEFIHHGRDVLGQFSETKLNIQSQKGDFKQLSSRSSLALGNAMVHSPTGTTQTFDRSNPAAIEFELRDFKELLSKLKVTYLEQETKETFLRVILDEDDDEAVEHGQGNLELKLWKIAEKDIEEAGVRNQKLKDVLVGKKKALESASNEIRSLVDDACAKFEKLKTETDETERLLDEMEQMRTELAELEQAEQDANDSEINKLSYEETQEFYNSLKIEEAQLDRDIYRLQVEVIPVKKQELGKLKSDLLTLTQLRTKLEEVAATSVQARQAGLKDGKIAAQENVGRWYSNILQVLKSVLGIEHIAIDNEVGQITLACTSLNHRPYEVRLSFSKGRFYDALLIKPSTVNIKAIVNSAVQSNDVRYFLEQLKVLVDQQKLNE